MTIILENERGEAIHTLSKEFDYSQLTELDHKNYSLLKYVDFYGNTTFNSVQLDDLQSDFEKLKLEGAYQHEIIQGIIDLIEISRKRVHSYIKFYGD